MAVEERPIITVIGSLNADLVTRTSRIPAAGETLQSESFAIGCGGKGANQAVACARLSKHDLHADGEVDVRMIGSIGIDSFGDDLIKSLHRDGINTDGVQIQSHMRTGVSVIFVEEESGENRIMFSPGANEFIEPKWEKAITVDHPNLLVLQLEIPVRRVLEALRTAKANGIDVLFNPAPASELPEEAYSAITHLIMNETEATVLSKMPGNDWDRISRKFQDLGVRNVIITLGSEGVYYAKGDQKGRILAEKVKVVDTTAAGDTFVGAYAVSVVSKSAEGEFMSIEEAARIANRAAALTVQKSGAQDAIPYRGALPP